MIAVLFRLRDASVWDHRIEALEVLEGDVTQNPMTLPGGLPRWGLCLCRLGPHRAAFLYVAGQRVWKRQPEGGLRALGTLPPRRISFWSASGSGIGTAESKASVYG